MFSQEKTYSIFFSAQLNWCSYPELSGVILEEIKKKILVKKQECVEQELNLRTPARRDPKSRSFDRTRKSTHGFMNCPEIPASLSPVPGILVRCGYEHIVAGHTQ